MRVMTLALAGVMMVGCGDGLGGFLVSNEQEVELGQGVDTQLRDQYMIATPNDPATVWMVGFIDQLKNAAERFRPSSEFGGYKVAIIADDELVNAFAAPGGWTYISTGLILQAHTCAEIAGVMGHELGHVVKRHSVKQIEETFAVSQISEWFLGTGVATDVAETVYSFLQNTQFSQEHEAEADLIGVQISHDAGYNPYGLADFFQQLLELEQQSGGAPPKFLSSHPATADRITSVTNEIEKRYGDQVNPGTTQTYNCVGTALTLDALQAHVRAGVEVIPGTGTHPDGP